MPRPRFLSKLGSWGSKVNKWRKDVCQRLCLQKVAEKRPQTPISLQNEVSPEEAPAGQRPVSEHQPSNSSRPPNGGHPSSSFSSLLIPSHEPIVDVPAGDSQAPVAVAANKTLKPATATASHPSALDLANGATSSCPQTPSARSNLPSPISSLDSNANTRPAERGFWPTKPSLLGSIAEPQGAPVCGGAFSDVWCCKISFCTPSKALPTEVAVKVLRPFLLNKADDTSQNKCLLQRFQQEGRTWFGLDHPNIVPLIGWTLTPNLSFISPWYKQGNLARYLKTKKLSRRERLQLLLGVAKGLEYLHSLSPPVVHGDLKPDNVLLSDEREALLTDFGLSTVVGQESMYSPSHFRGGSVPWMSPEQMFEDSKSCQSDVYSFGSLAFAVLTGTTPYRGLTSGQIICKVCHPINPRDPVKNWSNYPRLQGSVRDLLRDCWSRPPDARPPMSEVVRRLTTLLKSREA